MDGMEALFRRSERGRGAFLSRLFAFLSEEVVRHWSACEQAPYRDVGRPVVWDEDRSRYHVLDFTLDRRTDGASFAAEMKCEIEFEGYRYLTLTGVNEIEHHVHGSAFQKLLRLARDPQTLRVTIGGAEQGVAGAILVWGIVTPEGRSAAMAHTGSRMCSRSRTCCATSASGSRRNGRIGWRPDGAGTMSCSNGWHIQRLLTRAVVSLEASGRRYVEPDPATTAVHRHARRAVKPRAASGLARLHELLEPGLPSAEV